MRDAMKAANKAKRFDRIGFDVISLRSENRHRIGPENLSGVSQAPYKRPSENILSVTTELEYLRDKKETEEALAKIE
jgi:hypothetical protein